MHKTVVSTSPLVWLFNHMRQSFLKKCIILLGHTHDKILKILLLLVRGCLTLVRFLEVVPVEAAHYDYYVNLKFKRNVLF